MMTISIVRNIKIFSLIIVVHVLPFSMEAGVKGIPVAQALTISGPRTGLPGMPAAVLKI